MPLRRSLPARLLVLAILGSGCGTTRTAPSNPDIVITPERIAFPSTPVGSVSTASIALQNLGRASGELVVASFPSQPFGIADVPSSLNSGAAVTVDVRFAPTVQGEAIGSVEIRVDGVAHVIAFRGVGVSACEADAPCMSSTWNGSECVPTTLPDGIECASRCVASGRCAKGACVGELVACDDGDECTADFCSAVVGCAHAPVECAPAGPCQASQCVPGRGCVTSPVQDGVACGPATCSESKICISGACVSRPTPNGANCDFSPCQKGSCAGGTCVPSAPVTPLTFGAFKTFVDAGVVTDVVVDDRSATLITLGAEPVRAAETGFVQLPAEVRRCLSVDSRLSCVGVSREQAASGAPLLFEDRLVHLTPTGAIAWRLDLGALTVAPWDSQTWRPTRLRIASASRNAPDIVVLVELLPRADILSRCRAFAQLRVSSSGQVLESKRLTLPSALDACSHPHLAPSVSLHDGTVIVNVVLLGSVQGDPVGDEEGWDGLLIAYGADGGVRWTGAEALAGHELSVSDDIVAAFGRLSAYRASSGAVLYEAEADGTFWPSAVPALVRHGDVIGPSETPEGSYVTSSISRRVVDGGVVWRNAAGSRCRPQRAWLACAKWTAPDGADTDVVMLTETDVRVSSYECGGTNFLTALRNDDGGVAWSCPMPSAATVELGDEFLVTSTGGREGSQDAPLTIGRIKVSGLRRDLSGWCASGGGSTRQWAE